MGQAPAVELGVLEGGTEVGSDEDEVIGGGEVVAEDEVVDGAPVPQAAHTNTRLTRLSATNLPACL